MLRLGISAGALAVGLKTACSSCVSNSLKGRGLASFSFVQQRVSTIPFVSQRSFFSGFRVLKKSSDETVSNSNASESKPFEKKMFETIAAMVGK